MASTRKQAATLEMPMTNGEDAERVLVLVRRDEAILNIAREVDRFLREGWTATMESRLRMWINTPGVRGALYPPVIQQYNGKH